MALCRRRFGKQSIVCSASLFTRRRISIQVPPNGKQIGGSYPIYLSLFYLRDDGKVFGCGFDFSMRKAELCLSTSDQVGHTSRSVLQIIEDVAANQSAMRNPTHDTESLLFLVRRLALILAEMSFASVIRIRKIATTFGRTSARTAELTKP